MMSDITPHTLLLAALNFALCSGIGWACLCRLNNQICKHHRRPRLRYTLLLGGAFASGFAPLLFGAWPTLGGVLLAAAVLAELAINVVRWPALDESLKESNRQHDNQHRPL